MDEVLTDDSKETIKELRGELQQKTSEVLRLKDENTTLKQNEEELKRQLDLLSDTSNVVSSTRRSTSDSLDTHGATGGQVKPKGIVKNLLKKLPGRKKDVDTGQYHTTGLGRVDQDVSVDNTTNETSSHMGEASAENSMETITVLTGELQRKESDVKRLMDENAALKKREEELTSLLNARDSGFLSDTSSVISWTSTSTSASSHSPDTQEATGGKVKSKSKLEKLLNKIPRRKKAGGTAKKRMSSIYTLDQLSAITDSIGQREVMVKRASFHVENISMMNIARKFEKSGPTLLVTETDEQREEARVQNTCSFIMTKEEWRQKLESGELSVGIANMVTNCSSCPDVPDLKGKCWRFVSDGDDVPVKDPEETASKDLRIVVCLLFNEDKTSFLSLQCSHMEVDKNCVCHVTDDGSLTNTGPIQVRRPEGMRFKTFLGTFSTSPIRILPMSTLQLVAQPSPHYFELEVDFYIEGTRLLRFKTILEFGLVENGELGKTEMSFGMLRSWCVRFGGCSRHKMEICAQVFNEYEHIECFPLPFQAGSQVIRRFGVVVDTGIGRICIIDLNHGTVMLKVDDEFQEDLYPVFGVYASPDDATVKMRPITGTDIKMDDNKEKMIYSCMAW